MRLTAILLLLAMTTPAVAQTPIVLSGIQDGTYVLTVKAGQVTLTPATVVTPGGPVVPPVVPPIVPPVVTPTVAAEVAAEVAKIPVNDSRHQSAVKLSALYRFVAQQVRAGTIPQANIGQAVDAYIGIILAGDNRWGGVTAKVAGLLATCASPSSCAALLDEAADGILSTVPEPLRDKDDPIDIPEAMKAAGVDQELAAKAERYGIDWTILFNLLLKLLPIILKLFSYVSPYIIPFIA